MALRPDLTEHMYPVEHSIPWDTPTEAADTPHTHPAVRLDIQLEAGSQECFCWNQQLQKSPSQATK